jgi:putative nucleotidyltransferase with HDIG domain
MLLAVLVPLLLSSTRLINANRDTLATAEQLLQLDQTRSIAQQARIYLQATHGQVIAIARTFELEGDARAVAARISSALTSTKLIDFINEQSRIEIIRVYDRRGHFNNAGVSLQTNVIEDHLLQSYLEALKGEPWVSPAHVVADPLYYTVVVISAPVRSTNRDGSPGSVIGVVSALVSLEPLQEMVEAKELEGRDVYVVDGRGFLIAHSDRRLLFERSNFSQSVMVKAFQESKGQISRSVNFDQIEGATTQAMVGTYTSIGDPNSRVPFLSRLDWGAIVQAEEEAVYFTVRQMERTSYSVAIVFAALGIFLAIVFAGRLSRPISHLAEGARRLAAGDFSQNIDVRSRNEIGELADTFNLMTAEIRSFINKLRKAAEENKEMFMGTIRSLAAAIDAKDPYTRGHSERVSHYAEMIARTMRLSEKEVEVVRIGALMHDVGKIGIEDKILGKAGPLNEDEFEIMKTHPSKGAIIIEPVGPLQEMIPAMKFHHENIDGSGYPQGLSGEDIPLYAKIVAVADTFDAMTTNRPYQKAMEITYVFERMRSFVGKKFDKEIVDALIAAYEEGLVRPNLPLRPAASSDDSQSRRSRATDQSREREFVRGASGSRR